MELVDNEDDEARSPSSFSSWVVHEESLGETKHKVIKSKIAYRTVYYCPICDESLGDDNSETSFYYCPCCKTALDWEGIK